MMDNIPDFFRRVRRLEAMDAGGVGKTYTVTWASVSNPQPAIGNGTLVGRYFRVGKLILASINLTAGSTTIFGTSAWTFSLPVQAAAMIMIGSAVVVDASLGNIFAGVCKIDASGSVISAVYMTGYPRVESISPFTWASTDWLALSILYETV